jgi:sugar lactone lactonase YvrE
MKKFFIFHFLLSLQPVVAQNIGIGTTSPAASAKLDISSTSQGILIPTLTSVQRSTINNPAQGLLVFQTDGTPGFYYFSGISWVNLTNGRPPNSEGFTISANAGVTTTLAGSGSPGAVDGAGGGASFQWPFGVAADANGNLYVADQLNHKIRKITPTGVVSTLAGNGSPGAENGTGPAASFRYPIGVAADASGNVYVADGDNHMIRKIDVSGQVSVVAGTGSSGSADGMNTIATFNLPYGVAVDATGNLYVADMLNHKIRKITAATGEVSTFAGSGTQGAANGIGASASFNFPQAVAVDGAGNVYVADTDNHRIRKITAGGEVSTLAGSGSQGSADGMGLVASFNFPQGVAVDALGNVYVADRFNFRIRRITPAGLVSTLSGSGSGGSADGIPAIASFNEPVGVTVDAFGNVYVADNNNNKIRKIIAR